MISIKLILMVLAFVCFALGTFGVPAKVNWTNAGLALWTLSILIAG